MMDVSHPEIREALRRALEEDIGAGDITSQICVPAGLIAHGRYLAREPQIVAGVELLPLIFEMRGGVDSLELTKASGDLAQEGEVLATVRGRAHTLLECERVSLNFLQRLGGVATLARRFADAVAGTGCRILDTRKTTPGLRRLEKMAAAAGGITNHRMGLFDAVLIKNNHISAAGGVRNALRLASSCALPVEIEVRTKEEIVEALDAGATSLLLDNFSPSEAAAHIRFVNRRATVEISGGVTVENVRAYAEAGADFVSAGAITHSAPAVDVSFRLEAC